MMPTQNSTTHRAIFSCLLAAVLWGLLWYPLRILNAWGLSGLWSSLLIYLTALLLISRFTWQQRRLLLSRRGDVIAIGLFAGWTNLAFILAMLEGTVVRVLLLFYLSPVWSVLLARLFLKEAISRIAWSAFFLAIGGAVVMLWQGSQRGLTLDYADFLALTSGMAFSMTNMLVRRSGDFPIVLKMSAAWTGVVMLALTGLVFNGSPVPEFNSMSLLLVLFLAFPVMPVMTWTAQYGATHLPLHRSSVIFLVEVVAGAVSAALLTDETIGLREWLGGAMVLLAAMLIAWDAVDNDQENVSL